MKEVTQALRALSKSPGFSLTAGAILAVGLGLAMYMFAAINAYVLKPLPFPDPGELVHMEFSRPSQGDFSIEVPLHDFIDFRRDQTAFREMAGFYGGTVNIGGDERPERFNGAFVSANTFKVLRVAPALGRDFLPEEEAPGAPAAIILGDDVWRNRYGGDRGVVGHVVRVNGREATIVGVMPPGFRFPFNEDVWVPMSLDTRSLKRGEGSTLEVFGRLAPGASLSDAQGGLQAIARRLGEIYPETNAETEVVLKPYAEEFVSQEARSIIYTMFGAVLLVLLIACANVANLLIARNVARLREFSIRTALGASRTRIVLHVLIECLVISLLGGALAIMIAQWAGERTMEIIRTAENFAPPYWVRFDPDWRTWSFALVVALAAAVAAGVIPALRAARTDINANLRQGGLAVAGVAHGRLTRTLVTAQIALACVVLIGGGLMARSVISLRHLDLGAQTQNVLTGRIGLFPASYPEASDRLRFLERLADRIAVLPQAESVTLSTSLPGTSTGYGEVHVEGAAPTQQRQFAQVITCSPNYFDLFEVKIQQGRGFWNTDRAGALPVAIVNRHFADRYWPGTTALGRRVRLGSNEGETTWLTVVGVVPDIVQGVVGQPMRPALYRPLAQAPPQFVSLAIRTEGSPLEATEPMRKSIVELDRDLPVYWVRTLQDWIDLGRFQTHFLASLFGFFSVVGLLLGAVGQYALLAYTVSLRSREIGVRRALGAADRSVLALLLRQTLEHLGVGLAAGLVVSLAAARLLSAILYGVKPYDPATFGVVAAVIVATTALAGLLPTRRALRVDPMKVLRDE